MSDTPAYDWNHEPDCADEGDGIPTPNRGPTTLPTRLRAVDGREWEHTLTYNGVRLEAADRIEQLERSLLDVFALIDEGFLVRDTSHDNEPGWAIKQLDPVRRLFAARRTVLG